MRISSKHNPATDLPVAPEASGRVARNKLPEILINTTSQINFPSNSRVVDSVLMPEITTFEQLIPTKPKSLYE